MFTTKSLPTRVESSGSQWQLKSKNITWNSRANPIKPIKLKLSDLVAQFWLFAKIFQAVKHDKKSLCVIGTDFLISYTHKAMEKKTTRKNWNKGGKDSSAGVIFVSDCRQRVLAASIDHDSIIARGRARRGFIIIDTSEQSIRQNCQRATSPRKRFPRKHRRT